MSLFSITYCLSSTPFRAIILLFLIVLQLVGSVPFFVKGGPLSVVHERPVFIERCGEQRPDCDPVEAPDDSSTFYAFNTFNSPAFVLHRYAILSFNKLSGKLLVRYRVIDSVTESEFSNMDSHSRQELYNHFLPSKEHCDGSEVIEGHTLLQNAYFHIEPSHVGKNRIFLFQVEGANEDTRTTSYSQPILRTGDATVLCKMEWGIFYMLVGMIVVCCCLCCVGAGFLAGWIAKGQRSQTSRYHGLEERIHLQEGDE